MRQAKFASVSMSTMSVLADKAQHSSQAGVRQVNELREQIMEEVDATDRFTVNDLL